MIAARMVLSNLLYVVGAVVAATIVSGIVLLRHRRPKSLEAGIEMFSRELRALQPQPPDGPDRRAQAGRGARATRSGSEPAPPATGTRRREPRAPSPDPEDEPG